MKRIGIILIGISALLVAEGVMAVAGPIDFTAVTKLKRLKESLENPIDLYRSTVAAAVPGHGTKLFTVRTLLNLGAEQPSEFEKKALRNEICASFKLFSAPVANKALVGSMGIYLKDGSIVSVADNGLSGERLDSVLRRLSSVEPAGKDLIARHYLRAMYDILAAIQGGNIIWNNANVRNFYVRPDGELTATDFSEAEGATAAAILANPNILDIQKAREKDNFISKTAADVFKLLFPSPGGADGNAGDALAKYTAAVGQNPQAAVSAANKATSIGNVAALAPLAPVPYIPSGLVDNNVTIDIGDHNAAGDAGNGAASNFYLQPAVLPFMLKPAIGGGAAVEYLHLNEMCTDWTGK